jgi:cytochrome c553
MMKNTANMLTDADKILIAKYYANQSFKVNMK